MNQRKFLYFDVETTGLNPAKHDITQLSGLIEIDGEVVDGFNFNLKPYDFTVIDPRAWRSPERLSKISKAIRMAERCTSNSSRFLKRM
ncbi:MAG: hypothetical protein U5N56_00180 [Candidatus Marinimicrobia bacterium]|nr:hypothetical protein [Candidatus Neomarinimicrobiota bacterium]